MSKEDDNKPTGQKAKGFGSNPHLINKGGRPKGSRNKSSLVKTQLKIDSLSELAVDVIAALATNRAEDYGIVTVKPETMLSAAKALLDKSISQEKEKLNTKPKNPPTKEGSADKKPKPSISRNAK